MLEELDLAQSVGKKAYKKVMPLLTRRLFELQKQAWDAKVPVIVLFEGWDAAGKGTTIQKITSPLDPRGYKLHPIRPARTFEKKHPWLWRYWLRLPAAGEMAIFDRSWYGRVMVERMRQIAPEKEWRRAYRDIVDFERTLADDGHLIVKYFLHISKREQKRRFEKLTKDPLTAWHITAEDWENHRAYDEWLLAYEEAFERTDTEWGPWTIIEATDRRHTWIKAIQTLVRALEDRLDLPPSSLEVEETPLSELDDEDAPEPSAAEMLNIESDNDYAEILPDHFGASDAEDEQEEAEDA